VLTTHNSQLITHPYDGSQLRSGWIAETFGLSGEAIVAFTGPCDVAPEHMLDLEDLQAGESIRAALMLHFIIEHPGIDLALAVARQRLLAALVREILTDEFDVTGLTRSGDDLYLGERKLSISIAALSSTSGLIHFALNIDPTGAPVPAIGLRELGVDEEALARRVMEAYAQEIASSAHAAGKVRPAR
jgi:hypothetical protein